MSLKALRELMEIATEAWLGRAILTHAQAEIAALEKAAKDLTRLHLSDGVDDVAHREHVIAAMTDDPSSQWNHPDVRAWSDAATLLASIAEESE